MGVAFPLFIIGLAFGSFANVCAWRIPRGESVVFPRSHCPRCGAAIPWYLNIPVLSFLSLRGRCADCRAPISWQYPLVEFFCGVLFALQGIRVAGATLLAGLVLSFVLLTVAVIDIRHRIIPDVLSLGLLGAGLLVSPWNSCLGTSSGEKVGTSLIGAGAAFAVMFALAWGGEKVFKKEALGGGDIKLMAAVGAFLGWRGAFVALFLGSLAGTVAAVVGMATGRLRRGDYLPFGPFLALGSWASWMGGARLWSLLVPV